MKLTIKQRKEDPLLKREEIVFAVENIKATPSRAETRQELAEQLGIKEGLIVVESIKQEYGKDYAEGKARAYKSLEDIPEIELEYLVKRNAPKAKEEKEA